MYMDTHIQKRTLTFKYSCRAINQVTYIFAMIVSYDSYLLRLQVFSGEKRCSFLNLDFRYQLSLVTYAANYLFPLPLLNVDKLKTVAELSLLVC